jgi:hypothetical protein
MNSKHLPAILLCILLAIIPGCHYYIDAVPHVTLSSEPFSVETSRKNTTTPLLQTPIQPNHTQTDQITP